jgi:phosphate transport system substrate-binding protein
MVAIWLILMMASHSCVAEIIRIGGTGTAMPLMRKLSDQFQKTHPEVSFEIMSPPLGSGGGMRALAGERLDVVVSSKKPSKEDENKFAPAIPWLKTPFVIAGAGCDSTRDLNLQQLADIYSLKVKAWPDGKPIRLVMRSLSETDSLAIRSLSPQLDSAIVQTFEMRSVPVAENDLDNLQLLEKIQGSLGTASLGLLRVTNSPLKSIKLNGEEGSVANMQTGRYPLSKTLFLITLPHQSVATSDFIGFLLSREVMKKVKEWDYVGADQ